MYAETDFYLALLKESDWLKQNAERLYRQYRDEMWTSQITAQELLLYARKHTIRAPDLLDAFYDLARVVEVDVDAGFLTATAHTMDTYNTTPFDAMHAMAAREDGIIISSDSVYDRIGLKRIRLERSGQGVPVDL